MADLKPCPFCGGDAGCNRRSGDERDGYADHVTIFCTGCGVRVAASGDTSKGGYADNSTVYERAIAAWNRRAASPADQGEDAEYRNEWNEHLQRYEWVRVHNIQKMIAAEDARDAARYRWLRERHWNESTLFVVAGHHSLVRLGTDCPSDDRLDAAIDAAMSSSKEGA